MEIGSVIFLFVGLAVAVVFMGFKVVPQGSQWTVERFGRYTNTLTPGLNIIVPVMDKIGDPTAIARFRSEVLEAPGRRMISPECEADLARSLRANAQRRSINPIDLTDFSASCAEKSAGL